MTIRTRVIFLLLLLFGQMLYLPINRIASGGVILAMRLDEHIPLWPAWSVPYLLSLPWWLGCYIWAALKMEAPLYRALLATTAAVMFAGYAVYLLYPTYVERPALPEHGWAAALVRLIYSSDRSYNAFPSGHTYTTAIIALFWWRWRPKGRPLWVVILVLVLLSTLFTGQHNIADLIGGILFAVAGQLLGLWFVRRYWRRDGSGDHSLEK